MFYFNGHFALPEVIVINTIGQLIDAYLFIYLVNGIFYPRKNFRITHGQTFALSVFMTALLFLVDITFHNGFYPYYITVILIPLGYSVLFFRGKFITKATICFIFTTMILGLENLIILFPYTERNPATNYIGFLISFSVQRIWIKLLLFWIVRKLLLWPKEENIRLPLLCWLLFLIVSAGDTLLLVIYRIPCLMEGPAAQLVVLIILVIIPIFLLMIMKHISVAAEKNRIISVQMSQWKTQNQYLRQQLEMVESLRQFRHDYKAHLFCMDTLLEAGKYDELHQYLLSLHQYQYKGVHLRQFVDDESLNIILNQKVTLAEKYGIVFETDIILPDTGKIMISDLNALIVNLCDNAIEACATLPEAKISLDIHKVKAYLMIELTNTCKDDVQRTNPDFQTNKSNPEFHGMGIKIIKNITEKYHGQYQVFSTEHSFTTNLMLLDE